MRIRIYNTIRRLLLRALFVCEGILALRALLRLSTARGEAPAVQFINFLSMPLVFPFKNIFPLATIREQFVLDTIALTAIAGYLLAFVFIDWIVKIIAENK